jgi:hypothetical protein
MRFIDLPHPSLVRVAEAFAPAAVTGCDPVSLSKVAL